MKRIFQYIWHFFYVAIHWNIWLAFFTLYHDLKGGIRYGIDTFNREELHNLTLSEGDLSLASPYEPINYYMLEDLLRQFRKRSPLRTLVDLGSGKGRVLVVAGYFGFTNITGIDMAKELCDLAKQNVRKKETLFPDVQWTVIHDNVVNYGIRKDDSVFFMFNPFRQAVIQRFLENLDASLRQYPRKTWFLYASPVHADLLIEHGYHVVYEKQVLNLQSMILTRD